MEQKKILFTDLDGTLLDDNKNIGPESKAAIAEALAAGHKVVISTGRTLFSAKRQARRLGLDGEGCYIISFNGGQIYDCGNDQILYSVDCGQDLVRFCFDEAHKENLTIQTYIDNIVYTEGTNNQTERYCNIQGLTWVPVDDVIAALGDVRPIKMLIIDDDHEKLVTFMHHLQSLVEGRLDVIFSQYTYLEIVPAGVSKGNAVRFLCDHLGIPVENSVSAGDAENDMSMILAAGTGCVMCNGNEELKAAADYITKRDNNHDGAADIIRQFILQ